MTIIEVTPLDPTPSKQPIIHYETFESFLPVLESQSPRQIIVFKEANFYPYFTTAIRFDVSFFDQTGVLHKLKVQTCEETRLYDAQEANFERLTKGSSYDIVNALVLADQKRVQILFPIQANPLAMESFSPVSKPPIESTEGFHFLKFAAEQKERANLQVHRPTESLTLVAFQFRNFDCVTNCWNAERAQDLITAAHSSGLVADVRHDGIDASSFKVMKDYLYNNNY